MTTKCKQLVYELRLATSGHESHNSHISSGTGEYFFLMAFHTLSLLLFPLLHFPPLRYAPAFSTFAFSTRAFSAPPAQAAPYDVVPVCFQYRTSPGDQSGVTIQILFGLIGRVGKDRQDVFVSHIPRLYRMTWNRTTSYARCPRHLISWLRTAARSLSCWHYALLVVHANNEWMMNVAPGFVLTTIVTDRYVAVSVSLFECFTVIEYNQRDASCVALRLPVTICSVGLDNSRWNCCCGTK